MPGRPGADARLDRGRFELEFADDFTGPLLDESRWIPHYLPQWTTPERSVARFDLGPGGLTLRIDAEQPAWSLHGSGFRVSNLQTAAMSGPVGSAIGTHRIPPDVVVATAVGTRGLYTPAAGLVEATVRAPAEPTCMLAVWLVGLEDSSPDDSGEICIAELFGDAAGPRHSRVRHGVKAINDPRLRTDVVDTELPFDTTEPHTYGAEWDAERVHLSVDGRRIRRIEQGLRYPMQLMVDLFEFPPEGPRDARAYPKTAQVHAVRGYRHAASTPGADLPAPPT